MLISRSHSVEPLFPNLISDGLVVEMISELNILGVIASQNNYCFFLE